eukprot:TRINITY_DN11236_c0_g1_i5.p1 TRINITY_DN11236_c0_g1~~TRINITY_DN11236_c0_g1_i5.p1  ORF type:complete len:380 (-),score=49.30 TRINITY_DN11236_c0_g1_i5:55-1194(-)
MITASLQPLIANNLIVGPLGWPLYILAILLYLLHKLTDWVHPYLHMTYDAMFMLYTGSFLSLRFFTLVKKPPATSTSYSWLTYPLCALVFLLGIFFIVSFVGKTVTNFVLTLCFCYIGVYAVKHWLDELLFYANCLSSYKFVEVSFSKGLRMSYYDLICYIPCIILILLYALTKYWILNNTCAFAFYLYALRVINIKKLNRAFIMLGLFLVYDLYFVFGTEIMETLATTIEGPIKLIYPNNDNFALIGLGDILLPGIVISFCLRIDVFLYFQQQLAERKATLKEVFPESARVFDKPYFTGSLAGYLAGLVVTIVVTHVFRLAQPALLYLVPGVVAGVCITAFVRGEVKGILNFDEEEMTRKLITESRENMKLRSDRISI